MRFIVTEEERQGLVRQVPEFARAVRAVGDEPFGCGGDLFCELCRSIVSQQLAVRAAEAIFTRFEKLLGKITPKNLRGAAPEALRGCGLSARKVEYLRGAAQAAISGAIDFDRLADEPDETVISALSSLKGVGRWTAEMLLIFSLGRHDVLSTGDLGVRRGLEILFDRDDFTIEELADLRRRVSPYGTLASLALWRIKDGADR